MRAPSVWWFDHLLDLRERTKTRPRDFPERPREVPKPPRLKADPVAIRAERPYLPGREIRGLRPVRSLVEREGLGDFGSVAGSIFSSLLGSASQLVVPVWLEREKAKAAAKTQKATSKAYTTEAIQTLELQRQYEAQQRALEQERTQGTTAPGLSWTSWAAIAAGAGLLLLLARKKG